MVNGIFATPVGLYEIGRNLTAEEFSFLSAQEVRLNLSNRTSVNTNVLDSEKLISLRNFIGSSIINYVNTVHSPESKVDLKITQSWVNYTNKNEYHHPHTHPNSFISGVFYIQTNKNLDKIFFRRQIYSQFKFSNEVPTAWTSEIIGFPAVAGCLILFPSSLVHGVEPVLHDQTRISLSFNTFPFGNLGDPMNLHNLKIGGINETI